MSAAVTEALKDAPEPLTAEQHERFDRLFNDCHSVARAVLAVSQNGLRAPSGTRSNGPSHRVELERRIADFQAGLQICINAADLDAGTIGERRRQEIARIARLGARRDGGAA